MAFRVRTLRSNDPADSFPDPAEAGPALGYPDGLLAIGGDLSPERLVAAYSRGIFPWFNDDQPILWWSPDPRAVIYTDRFHMSRSLARMLGRDGWAYSLNQAFPDVIRGCAVNRGEHGTWITPGMQTAYTALHELGYAHSVESWYEGELAGGIYGLRLGHVFFGESMYSAFTGGSKAAISGLIKVCLEAGITMLDCQLPSEHLKTLGMIEIPREDFLVRLRQDAADTSATTNWGFGFRPAAELKSLYKTVR